MFLRGKIIHNRRTGSPELVTVLCTLRAMANTLKMAVFTEFSPYPQALLLLQPLNSYTPFKT
jgi:hypothetical protein